MADADAAIKLLAPCDYEQRITLCEGIEVEFHDIGHLLGSACIEVWVTEGDITKKIVFSGDVGNTNQPIIRDPGKVSEADYVVILDAGHVVAHDTPVGLKNAYASDFIKVYCKNEKLFEMIAREELSAEEKEDYVVIEVPSVEAAKRLIVTYPDAFEDFEVEKGKMDDVFLKVTGKQLQGGDANA